MNFLLVISLCFFSLISGKLSAIDLLENMASPLVLHIQETKERHLNFLSSFLSSYGQGKDISAFHQQEISSSDFLTMLETFHADLDRRAQPRNQLLEAAQRNNFELDKDLPFISFYLLYSLFQETDFLNLFLTFYNRYEEAKKLYSSNMDLYTYNKLLQPLLSVIKEGRNAFPESFTKSPQGQAWVENLAFFLTDQTNYSFEQFLSDAQNNYFIKNVFWGAHDLPVKNQFALLKKPVLISQYNPHFILPRSRGLQQESNQIAAIILSMRILTAPQGIKSFINFNEAQLIALEKGLITAGFSTNISKLFFFDSTLNKELPLPHLRILFGHTYIGSDISYDETRKEVCSAFSSPKEIVKFFQFTDSKEYCSSQFAQKNTLKDLRRDIFWTYYSRHNRQKSLESLINKYSGHNKEGDQTILQECMNRRKEKANVATIKNTQDDDIRAIEEYLKNSKPVSKKKKQTGGGKSKKTKKNRDMNNTQKTTNTKIPTPNNKTSSPSKKTPKIKQTPKNKKPKPKTSPATAIVPSPVITLTQNDGIVLNPIQIPSDEEIRTELARKNRLALAKAYQQPAQDSPKTSSASTTKSNKKNSKNSVFSSLPILRTMRNMVFNKGPKRDHLRQLFNSENQRAIKILQKQAEDLTNKRRLSSQEKGKLQRTREIKRRDIDLTELEQKLLMPENERFDFPEIAHHFHQDALHVRYLIELLLPLYPEEIFQEMAVHDSIVDQQNSVIIAYNEYVSAKKRFIDGTIASKYNADQIKLILLEPEKKYSLAEIYQVRSAPERLDQDVFSQALWNVSNFLKIWRSNHELLLGIMERLEALRQLCIYSSSEVPFDHDSSEDSEDSDESDEDIEILLNDSRVSGL